MSIRDRMVEAIAIELDEQDNEDRSDGEIMDWNHLDAESQECYRRGARALLSIKIDGRYSLVVYDDEWGQPLWETEADQDVLPYHLDWQDEDGHH